MADSLSESEINQTLGQIDGWQHDAGRKALVKQFVFGDFVEAFGFMAQVALIVQQADHHPEWSNVYKQVDIALSTHSAGGVTSKDVDLANKIDAIAQRMK